MPHPVCMRVTWVPHLYGPDLARQLNHVFDTDPTTLAVVNRVDGCARLSRTLRLHGPERLAITPTTPRIETVRAPRIGLLGTLPGHGYQPHLPYPDDGPNFRVFLHRRIALVLPATANLRRTRRGLEDYFSNILLTKPSSAHTFLSFQKTLASIAQEAQGLLTYVWPHGITLQDAEGLLPAAAVLSPPTSTTATCAIAV